ncbi:MAG: hypothetical protein AAGI71_06605 [Bacteroidota bacterium]
MGRVIQTGDTPAKRRRRHLRSCAEVIRLLAQRPTFDAEAQDMAAFLVFTLRDLYAVIDASADSWDERGYWKKAEKLRHDWLWARHAAADLETLILNDRWPDVPPLLIGLVPHVSDVTVATLTRDADWWCGALRALRRASAS